MNRREHLIAYTDMCIEQGLPINRFTFWLYRVANQILFTY